MISDQINTRGPGGGAALKPALPARYYYDSEHYRFELEQIFFRNWLYFCRSEQLAQARDYRTMAIGDQNVFVVRAEDGGPGGRRSAARPAISGGSCQKICCSLTISLDMRVKT